MARIVAAKAVLAARVDASHESTDGRVGADFLADIEGKIEKLTEPPPVKAVKVPYCVCEFCIDVLSFFPHPDVNTVVYEFWSTSDMQ